MGLDMYLTKKTYIGANYEHRQVKAEIKITIGDREVKIDPKKISEITEAVGYWRKANQIHRWFVDNVQDGVDECQETYVPREKLLELRDLCKAAIKSKDARLLPPQSGFFFGSTDIDEYYWEELKDTIKIIEDLGELNGEYYYQSSW